MMLQARSKKLTGRGVNEFIKIRAPREEYQSVTYVIYASNDPMRTNGSAQQETKVLSAPHKRLGKINYLQCPRSKFL